MTRLLSNRITEGGRQAMHDLMDQVAQDLNQTIKTHGKDSLESAHLRLILSSMHFVMEEYREALALVQSYVTTCKTNLGPTAEELICGLGLLSNTLMVLEQPEEALSAVGEVAAVVKQVGRSGRDPLLNGLKKLAEKHQSAADPASVRRAFIVALMALSWCVTVCERGNPVYDEYFPRMPSVFEEFGFRGDLWEWLVRRAELTDTDFVGLVSVLMEEGMFPAEPTVKHSNESVIEDDVPLKGYEVSGLRQEHWTSDEGFSKAFPVMVAEGELSLRVERLLDEGCRCLRTTDELGTVFLIFSSNWLGRRITAFGTTTWSDEERGLMENTVREKISELGADSAMMLAWVDLPHREAAESDEVPTEAVLVVARDAKSYFRGLQPARKVDGKYVFHEPIVTVTEDDWFSEFTFPVEAAAERPPQKPTRESITKSK